jgi:hypothetical protein
MDIPENSTTLNNFGKLEKLFKDIQMGTRFFWRVKFDAYLLIFISNFILVSPATPPHVAN